MSMTPAELQMRHETDRDILYFTREMQARAEIRAESVHAFLTAQRRRHLLARETQDRLDYLADAGLLKAEHGFEAGERYQHYRITSLGMDVLDGARPAPWA